MSHLDYLESVKSYPVSMDKFMVQINFSIISYGRLFFNNHNICIYTGLWCIFNNKWCCLIGIFYSSALSFSVYMAIFMIGVFIIIVLLANMVNFQIIGYISIIFL